MLLSLFLFMLLELDITREVGGRLKDRVDTIAYTHYLVCYRSIMLLSIQLLTPSLTYEWLNQSNPTTQPQIISWHATSIPYDPMTLIALASRGQDALKCPGCPNTPRAYDDPLAISRAIGVGVDILKPKLYSHWIGVE